MIEKDDIHESMVCVFCDRMGLGENDAIPTFIDGEHEYCGYEDVTTDPDELERLADEGEETEIQQCVCLKCAAKHLDYDKETAMDHLKPGVTRPARAKRFDGT